MPPTQDIVDIKPQMEYSDVLNQIVDILSNEFNVPATKITPSATLDGDLGFDSLDIVTFTLSLEEAFDMNLNIDNVDKKISKTSIHDITNKVILQNAPQ